MASNYNMCLIPGIVFVREGSDRPVVRPQTYDDLISRDVD